MHSAKCGRPMKRAGSAGPSNEARSAQVTSPSTTTLTSTTTSVCGATVTVCSPTVFSGPFGMRTCALVTLKSIRFSASAMSALVTEPKRRPSTPAFCVMWTVRPLIFSPSACAPESRSAASFSSSARLSSNSLIAAGVARRAARCGIRKLRAKPSLTLTTSPRLPRLCTFSRRMTCMAFASDLVLVAVRQHRQEARALDARRQLALEERARAGQAGGRDLAVLVDEISQGVDVLVVDLLDAGDREAAEALATEQQRLGVALGLAVLVEPTFTAGRGHVVTSLLRCDGLDVKDDSATVALCAEKTCEDLVRSELGREERFGDGADRPAADLEAHLANAAGLGDLRFVAKAHVDGGQAGGREPQRRALDDLRRQRQPIG